MTAKKKKPEHDLITDFEVLWGKRPDTRSTNELNEEIRDMVQLPPVKTGGL